MERKTKECYESPATQVIELVQEGVICESPTRSRGVPSYNGFNKEEEW